MPLRTDRTRARQTSMRRRPKEIDSEDKSRLPSLTRSFYKVAFALVIKTKSRPRSGWALEERAALIKEYCWRRWSLGQPMSLRCSSGSLGVVRMLRGRHIIGKGMFGTVWLATIPALVVLSSLLVAQNVPLRFPAAPTARQCSIRSSSAQCQTQRFDLDGAQWVAPVVTTAILPSTGKATWAFPQKLHPAIQIRGFHFNRPPPTS